MANVSAISKTNSSYIMSYFINIETVSEKANQLDKIANENIGNWITILEAQIDDGGLDPYALNIGGDPILNTNAVKLVNELKQRQIMLADVEKKREKEDKISDLRQEAIDAKEELSERPGWDINIFVGSYQSQIDGCQEEIDRIDEQLETVRKDECYSYTGGE